MISMMHSIKKKTHRIVWLVIFGYHRTSTFYKSSVSATHTNKFGGYRIKERVTNEKRMRIGHENYHSAIEKIEEKFVSFFFFQI